MVATTTTTTTTTTTSTSVYAITLLSLHTSYRYLHILNDVGNCRTLKELDISFNIITLQGCEVSIVNDIVLLSSSICYTFNIIIRLQLYLYDLNILLIYNYSNIIINCSSS